MQRKNREGAQISERHALVFRKQCMSAVLDERQASFPAKTGDVDPLRLRKAEVVYEENGARPPLDPSRQIHWIDR